MTSNVESSLQEAQQVLRACSQRVTEDLDDDYVGTVLSQDVVDEILQMAWRHQFEDDRSAFKRDVRELVGDAVESAHLNEG